MNVTAIHVYYYYQDQRDIVRPKPAIAAVAYARGAGCIGLACDAKRRVLRTGELLRPEFALGQAAFATRRGHRVNVELAEIGVTDQQPGQLVREAEALSRRFRERFRELLLQFGADIEAILDIMFLPHGVG